MSGLGNKLNFMFNKISVPKMSMVYWLKVPEFVDAILEMYEGQKVIDDATVHEVMVRVYDQTIAYKGTDRAKDYNYAKMRQGIKHLSEVLHLNS